MSDQGPNPEEVEVAFEAAFRQIDRLMEQMASGEIQSPNAIYTACDEAVRLFGYEKTFDEFERRHADPNPDAPAGSMAENFVFQRK